MTQSAILIGFLGEPPVLVHSLDTSGRRNRWRARDYRLLCDAHRRKVVNEFSDKQQFI